MGTFLTSYLDGLVRKRLNDGKAGAETRLGEGVGAAENVEGQAGGWQ